MRRVKGSVYLVPGSPNTLITSKGDELVIVDPGIGVGRADSIAEAAAKLGGGRAAIVLTHGHTDHLAAAPSAAEALGAAVYAPRLCLGIVEDTTLRRLLVYGGLVSEELASMPMVAVRAEPLEPGARLPAGARLLPLPGHTPGHSGVVFEEDMVVAAGDAVLGEKVLARFGVPFAADLPGWRRSLEKLLELAEAGYVIVPGHGPVARDKRAKTMVEANMAAADRVVDYVRQAVADHGPLTLDKLAYLATRDLGAAEPTPRQMLLNRTALASVLKLLEEEGYAEPVATEQGPAWKRRNT